MDPFPSWSEDRPAVDTPFTGLEGRVISGPGGQPVFFRAAEDFEVPPHSHGAQWGIVVTGRRELTIGEDSAVSLPGGTYSIPAGETHSARLEAGTHVLDMFQEPDRYETKR